MDVNRPEGAAAFLTAVAFTVGQAYFLLSGYLARFIDRLPSFFLLLTGGLVLYFVSEAVDSDRVTGSMANPIVPVIAGTALGLASIVFGVLALVAGIRNKLRESGV